MQHHPTRIEDTPSGRVTIPAKLVDWVRRATYAEIGSAAEALDTLAFATDREAYPERFRAQAQNLRESFALLDALGWTKQTPPVPIEVALHEHGWALIRSLTGALEFADEDVQEQSRRAHGRVFPIDCSRVSALYSLIEDTRARIDILAVEEGPTAPETTLELVT